MKFIKFFITKLLAFFNIGLIRYENLLEYRKYQPQINELIFFDTIQSSNLNELKAYSKDSYSQIKQDLFVINELNFKKNGYFVEFGATDGKTLSNTFLLEKNFDWKGILAEPSKEFFKLLKNNRTACLDSSCVWKETGHTLNFIESCVDGAFSSIKGFSDNSKLKGLSNHYKVESISLIDLLEKHKAPREIDYLSIDTEGSEYEILKAFNFSKYTIKVITIEHNFDKLKRNKIYDLLTKNGYVRKYRKLSFFDDWYVKVQ